MAKPKRMSNLKTCVKLPSDLIARYLASPLALDAEVRQRMRIPECYYYTVSVWPEPGLLRVDKTRSRQVKSVKISKSHEHTETPDDFRV